MGLEMVEYYIEVEEKYGVNVEVGYNSLGEFILAVLFEYQRKHPDEAVLPRDVFNRLHAAKPEYSTIEVLAEALNRPAESILPEMKLEELFPRKDRIKNWNRFVLSAKKHRWDIIYTLQKHRICYAMRIIGILFIPLLLLFFTIFHELFSPGWQYVSLYAAGGIFLFWLTVEVIVYNCNLAYLPQRYNTVADLIESHKSACLPINNENWETFLTSPDFPPAGQKIAEDLKQMFIKTYGYNPTQVDIKTTLND